MKRNARNLFILVLALFPACNAQRDSDLDAYFRNIPFEMPRLERPAIPARTVSLADFGGVPDGVTLNTEAFAEAIENLAGKGGGRLEVPAGIWFTGPITLKSNIELHLDADAVIVFSTDQDLYPIIDTNFEGLDVRRCLSPVNALGDLNAAKGYFRPVRERAFKGHEEAAETYVNGISSKKAMFNAIVDERAFEFCGEMLRKGDLIRWGLLKSKMDEAKAEMFKLRDLKAPYDYMSGDIYFQITDDPSEFTIYGLHRGETLKPSGDWEKKGEYITKTVDNKGVESGLYDDRINGIYMADPEQHMFWPIFFDSITNSQGYLQNDYGYDNP